MKNKILKWLLFVLIVYVAIDFATTVFEIYDIMRNPDIYIQVDGIGSAENARWSHRCIPNYIVYDVVTAIASGIYVVLAVAFVRNKLRTNALKLFYIMTGIAILLTVRDWTLWIASGFDHYLRFDPSLF